MLIDSNKRKEYFKKLNKLEATCDLINILFWLKVLSENDYLYVSKLLFQKEQSEKQKFWG